MSAPAPPPRRPSEPIAPTAPPDPAARPGSSGVWQIIGPWVVGERPTGVLWTNVVMGAIVTVLGLAAAGLLVTTAVSDRRPHAAAAHH
ncbi:SPW repeat protein [Nocardia sp. MDA0666]|uniref:SPW repeat protein n=1 Tax=Nocardia sp. MDA0666 TaxID=2135448 RepID=UPI00272B31F4|nr:SPW repeat protein [Nocardia sp. MDA0666]